MNFRSRKVKIALFAVAIIIILGIWFRWMVAVNEPEITHEDDYKKLVRTPWNRGWKCGPNRIGKNDHGLYELYVEGDAFERGYINGLLARELIEKQEVFFVGQLEKHIPSAFNQYMIRLAVGWLNKDLDDYVPDEYKNEIYGISRFASPEYDYIAPAFQRILNYHGAHDIGHAMQNMNLVAGCSSFGVWGNKTKDGKLLLGRNFDFYVGDGFAEDKIIMFVKPDQGYRMMLVTWGGMIGVVSGMNEHGLTLTLNAAPSPMPSGTATPVSIIAREVLQYARTTAEAYDIVRKHKSFVAETFMVSAAQDKSVVVIEKTPDTTFLYQSAEQNRMLCTNHFQHDALRTTEKNIEQLKDNPTVYRYQRLEELLSGSQYDPISIAAVLRDQRGLQDANLGMGHEGALNQLIAHHSVIFSPEERIVWVSTNPYQLGAYVAYDLNLIFSMAPDKFPEQLYTSSLTIPADTFLTTEAYKNYQYYHQKSIQIREADEDWKMSAAEEKAFVASNPDYYNTYLIMARYYGDREQYTQALQYLDKASGKVIAGDRDKNYIKELRKEYTEAQQ